MNQNNQELMWSIVTSQNGDQCSVCGKVTNSFLPKTCWYSTFGLFQFGHPEFEIVIQQLPIELSIKILSVLGILVETGQTFQEGAEINFEGIDKEFHLKEFCLEGQRFLRLIISDDNGRYPEDEGCAYPFNLQLKHIDELCSRDECQCNHAAMNEVANQKGMNDDKSK